MPHKFIPPGHIADSGLLSTCIAVFIYSRQHHEAYGVHLGSFTLDNLDYMIRDAIAKFGSPDGLEVYVAGSESMFAESYDMITMHKQEYVINALKQSGLRPENTFIQWTPPHAEDFIMTVMTLDVDSGIVTLTHKAL